MSFNVKVDTDVVLARAMREGADGLLTLGEAVALIASRLTDAHDCDATARNRVRMQLDRALKHGGAVHCRGLASLPDGRFTVDEIVNWAIIRFPGKFSDLPHRPREILLEISDGFQIGSSLDSETTPSDSVGRLTLIDALREEIRELQAEAERAEAQRKQRLADNFKGKEPT